MRRAFPCALVLLAFAVAAQAAVLETTCEWIATGEHCATNIGPMTEIVYSLDPREVNGAIRMVGPIFPDIDPELFDRQHLTRLSFRYIDSFQFSFAVLGGVGDGVLQGYAIGRENTSPKPPQMVTGGLSINLPLNPPEPFQLPFTFGEPITILIQADFFARSDQGYFTVDNEHGFVLRPPEGAYFTEINPGGPVAHNPEPGTWALMAIFLSAMLLCSRVKLSRAESQDLPQDRDPSVMIDTGENLPLA